MKKIILILAAGLFAFGSFAQKADSDMIARAKSYSETSDPKAKVILDKVRNKYEAYNTLQLNFTLDIEGEIEESQKGKVSLKGERYKVEMKSQDIISNGNTIWFHLKNNNEVQINNPDPSGESGMFSPADLLKLYDKNLVYQLVDVKTENGRSVNLIEFKPKNGEESEFFKMRLSVDRTTSQMTKVIAFSRDGTRYIVTFDSLKANPSLSDSFFEFNPSKYPDIYVEDLREE